ncbi:glycerate kinase [Corynebacterium argentoratense]|uniref:glycerate kinase n=1 Tax=Corynebacterium argentoratense TaxID=42817 RepID=UPI003CD0C7C0
MLQALGVSIKDAEGQPIAAGLEGVASAASIDLSPAADVLGALRDVDIHVITDVTAPLLGTMLRCHNLCLAKSNFRLTLKVIEVSLVIQSTTRTRRKATSHEASIFPPEINLLWPVADSIRLR